MKKDGYGKPVLIAGIIAGILSATPLLNWLNIVCCLWVVVGGVIGVYLVCKDTEQTVNYGEGAFVGLLSGFVASVISTALFTVYILLGFNIAQYMPERIPQFEKFGDIITAKKVTLNAMVLWLIFSIVICGAFGALGGIIGTSIYAKKKEPEAKVQ